MAFLNYVPLSLLNAHTKIVFASISIFKIGLVIIYGVSSLECINSIQMYLEKSSTITKTYLFLPDHITFSRPKRSIWINCRDMVIELSVLLLWLDLLILSFWQASHTLFFTYSRACMSLTSSLFTRVLIALKFK